MCVFYYDIWMCGNMSHLGTFCNIYLYFFSAKDVQIPQELIDRLSNSEIRSISDLQRLLEMDSVGRPKYSALLSSLSPLFLKMKSCYPFYARRCRGITLGPTRPWEHYRKCARDTPGHHIRFLLNYWNNNGLDEEIPQYLVVLRLQRDANSKEMLLFHVSMFTKHA